MARYVDGFVIPLAKKNLEAYMKMAQKASVVFKEHGAVEYCECAADDIRIKFGIPFGKLAKLKPTETVVFSWVTYKSKAARDAANKKIMKDPRLAAMMDPKNMLFDMKRMSMGGFKLMVDA